MLTGCITGPPRGELADATFEPLPENYQDLMRDHLESTVLVGGREGYNPDIKFKPPYKAAYHKKGGDAWAFGYAVPVHATTPVNYGGYIAGKKHVYFFDRGRARYVHFQDSLKKVK